MTADQCLLAGGRPPIAPCSERLCPFWEETPPRRRPGCLLAALLPAEEWTPALAARWLAIRRRLEELARTSPA